MGNNLFGANISGKVAKALGSRLLPGTLTKTKQGTRDPSNLAAGRDNVSVSHSFRGILTGLSGLRKETILPDARDAVMILGDTVFQGAVPVVGDSVLIESTVYTIISVSRDPDAAAYNCQVK